MKLIKNGDHWELYYGVHIIMLTKSDMKILARLCEIELMEDDPNWHKLADEMAARQIEAEIKQEEWDRFQDERPLIQRPKDEDEL